MPVAWESRFSQLLKKAFALREGTRTTVLGDVMPVFPVASMEDIEWRLPRGERLGLGYGSPTAVAAQNGHVQLVNPSGSSMLVMVERFSIYRAAADNFHVAIRAAGTAVGTPVSTATLRDWRGTGAIRAAVYAGAAAWASSAANYLTTAGGNTVFFDAPIVLEPGSLLAIVCATVNVQPTVNFWWRERNVGQDELEARG